MAILDLISQVHLPSSVNKLPKYLKLFTFSSCFWSIFIWLTCCGKYLTKYVSMLLKRNNGLVGKGLVRSVDVQKYSAT
jgi:hypothetical protein